MSPGSRGEAGEVCAVLVRGANARGSQRWMGPSNEIGIDFPSMVPSLDRIRDAFFRVPGGEQLGGPFELVVAAHELGRSQDIILAVPYNLTCEACGGRGESWGAWCERCGSCGETDVQRAVRVTLPRRLTDGAHFRLRVVDRELGLPEIAVRIKVVEQG